MRSERDERHHDDRSGAGMAPDRLAFLVELAPRRLGTFSRLVSA
ncbi:MAG TPA: hypothetical protein VGO86_02045 [Candidatus Dormibacteraeota bacterium]